ncbi:MAG TPA: glycosyltransferase family 2 protein [Nitrospirales bacterium]|jgi:glycosyltransferase involved in cell wall biosynthesis
MPIESGTAVTSSVCPVELSIVVPLYNEFQNLDSFFRRLFAVLQRLEMTFEVICVDDGSTDNTLLGLLEYVRVQPSLKVINLSRNFGKETALTAGIDHAQGAAVVPLDADLQDPPELIVEFVEKWRKGYDVVYATRGSAKTDSWMKRATRRAFYWFIGHVGEIQIPSHTGDFRLLDRRVVDALKKFPERTRFLKGLFAWVGFKQTAVYYDRPSRHAGASKWNYWQLWNFALEGVTSFSSFPLKVWSYVGVAVSFCAVLYAAIIMIRTLVLGIDVPGYASLMVVILFLGGIQLITLGVLGEYLSRIYYEVKGRPLYIVRESYGFNSPKP